MPIESHIEDLQKRHPKEPLEIIRLACYLGDDIAKTKAYASILQTCNDYRDIAYKVVKDMYVKCLVDKVTAQKERTFITFLLALCSNVKDSKPHSARYHIKLMLESPEVRKEREEYERNRLNGENVGDRQRVTIEISSKYREITMPIIQSLIQSGAITLVDAKLNAQCKLNRNIRYVVTGSREEIIKSVKLIDMYARKELIFSPKRRSILGVPNRHRYFSIMPSKQIKDPGNILEVSSNPNIHTPRMLAQQQHGLIGRKIMAQPTETANGEIKIRLTGLGMRVIVDK